ncbi:MAG: von Willebrand factor type A domain-containing protein [Planctomycetota bacterium]
MKILGRKLVWMASALAGAAAIVGCSSEMGASERSGADGGACTEDYALRPRAPRQRLADLDAKSGDEPCEVARPAPGAKIAMVAGNTPAKDDQEPPAEAPTTTEHYTDYGVRPFVCAREDNRSTFSIDVDTGSYTIARRKLREGSLPPPAAVRVEEFVNYFRQDYPDPSEGRAFAVLSEASASPFREGKAILRIGLQGRRLREETRKRANLVFLIDTSGSMQSPDKLGLVKRSLQLLTDHLRADDRVSICTYAGSVSKVLDPTPASERGTILRAISRLQAGGSTAMSSGIDLAYQLAARQAGPEVTTRVIVCSDGDANVGPRSHEQILGQIDEYRHKGITLGTVGFGMGNYKDTMMEQLADKGNGSYAYVDSLDEARRLFGEDLLQSLEVIARDVKLQVVFDPRRVARYRLLGYENRAIADRDFRNDAVDAGEVGAGHTVTALYELELVPGSEGPLGAVHLRHKPGERRGVEDDRASEVAYSLTAQVNPRFEQASQRFRFTACVAEMAEILRKSPHVKTRVDQLAPLVERALDPKHDDREHDFVNLVERASFLTTRASGT